MARKAKAVPARKERSFHLEFKSTAQKLAWACFQQHDMMFMLGPAGGGKTFLSMAFAINEILAKRKQRIILTRPVVEAGESLGYLPGTFDEKLAPYMIPLVDSIFKLVGPPGSLQREIIDRCVEVRPLAYMRGSTFTDSVCIFDEAQNATYKQLKMFMTRIGENTKMIINGDPDQSDLPGPVALNDIVHRIQDIAGIGLVTFRGDSIIRHPLVARIIEKI